MDYSEARNELITILCMKLSEPIVDGFTSMMEEALKRPRPVDAFKLFLKDIQQWDDSILNDETRRIESEIPSLRRLLKAVMTLNIKLLSSMKHHSVDIDDQYITSKTPALKTFIHRIYLNAAKEFFYNPDLLTPTFTSQRQRQLIIIERVIRSIIHESLPLSELLSTLNTDDETTAHPDTLTIPLKSENSESSESESGESIDDSGDDSDDDSDDGSKKVKKTFF
jgi:hypothetical protein